MSELMVVLEYYLYLQETRSARLVRKVSIKKNYLTINNKKFSIVKRPVVFSILSKDISNIKSYSPRNTRNFEYHRNPTSFNRQKISCRTR